MIRDITRTTLALALLLAAPSALAQDDQARALFSAGAQAYEAGRYPAAIQAFQEAYRLSPRPGILFSIAQAYRRQYTADRQAGNLHSAIRHYREYIAKVEQGGRRADAISALSELEPLADRLGASGAAAPPPPARASATRVMVSAQIKEATIALDGQKPVEAPLIAEVKPGKHTLRIVAPGYFPEDREIQAAEGGVVALDIPMREKPGLLTVVARDGAEVAIDGRVAGTTPLPRALELTPGTHFVTVTKRGHKAFAQEMDLGRDEAKRVVVSLDTTGQRVGAYVLMGAGAAAAVAGGVLAGVAFYDQKQAQAIDDRRVSKGGLSVADLASYDSYRGARDELRRAAGIAFGSALVVGGTGVLLAIFDTPAAGPPRMRDQSPKPGAPVPRDRPMEMSAAPVIGPGFYGASLSGHF